jgi:hypothetical protein
MGERIVLGLTEEVTIIGTNDKEEKVTARVDSGATMSSIDMELASKLELGPVVKSKIVKSASGIKTRPVLKAKIRINKSTLEEEFSLADRSHMTYNVLIGQNILKEGNFLIDPNKK